ncbi:hypothetical protein PsYK624_104860 [Phanerochaete sordida]|uniref:Uncharacterized protein n=1 Tax=Phanerochaete sordida TaxID=48140 RepID=A0A9P3LHN1_9APHY|nr:hypothetical protein PsYK624_104860 [Phanerochaete sordida]
MDELSKDPELAPGLVKLLSEKLTETRRALGESRRTNAGLQAELNELREASAELAGRMSEERDAGEQEDLEQEVVRLHQELAERTAQWEDVCQENESMGAELDELRQQRLTTRTSEDLDGDVKPLTSCLARLCPAKDDIRRLQEEIENLEEHHAQGILASDEAMVKLRAELDKTAVKRDKYKAKLQSAKEKLILLAEAAEAENAARSLADGSGPASPHDLQLPEEETTSDDDQIQSYECRLDPNICPQRLPKDVAALSTAADVLFWPGRTIYPYGAGSDARLLASTMVCDTTTTPFCWKPSNHRLRKRVGTTRELFYLAAPKDVRYLGAYRCVLVRAYTKDEFRQLQKQVKDDIIDHAVLGGACVASRLTDDDRDSICKAYISGDVEVEFTHLVFDKVNRQYLDALVKYKVEFQVPDSPAVPAEKRKFSQTIPEIKSTSSKKARA